MQCSVVQCSEVQSGAVQCFEQVMKDGPRPPDRPIKSPLEKHKELIHFGDNRSVDLSRFNIFC